MLTRLSIRNVVLIDKLDLDFSSGLAVLTGETGAGKSILLDSLGLRHRTPCRSAVCCVRAQTLPAPLPCLMCLPIVRPRAILKESDIDAEGDDIILRRSLGEDGRTKAFINDQPVSVGLLKTRR